MRRKVYYGIAGGSLIASLVFMIALSKYNRIVRLEHFSFLFTIITAFINGFFLWMLIKQVELGRKSNELAQSAVVEAKKARIDANAPSLVVTIDRDSLSFPSNTDTSKPGKEGQEYVLPRDKNKVLSFQVYGEVKNEGKTTARLHSQGNTSFNVRTIKTAGYNWHREVDDDREVLLGPDQEVKFVWIDGHSVEEWIEAYKNNVTGQEGGEFDENSSCKIQFRAWDFPQNIFEYVDLELQGYPLQSVADDAGKVRLTLDKVDFTIHRHQRFYSEDERRKYKSPYEDRHKK